MRLAWIAFFGIMALLFGKHPAGPISSPTINQSTQATPSANTVFYPIKDFNTRLTVRSFGQRVTSQDQSKVPCGKAFVGIHDGDDLEALPSESESTVPVFSIANGKVIQVSFISGYGGLIVISYTLNNQSVTANFGHINLQSSKVKSGDPVTPGEKIAELGLGCSPQTDGERKHLHFAIHKGSAVDVKGYVQSQMELNSWIDPKDFLSKLNARNP